MEVKQIYALVNSAYTETVEGATILEEDLRNLVDIGSTVFNSTSYDNFTHALVDKVGKMVFVNRPYKGRHNYLMVDGWTFGAALQKVWEDMPDVEEAEAWKLQDNTSYDPFVTKLPSVHSKFFAKYVTFDVTRTITRKQMESAFNSAAEMSAFLDMLFATIEKRLTKAVSDLAARLVNEMIASCFYADMPSGTYNASNGGNRAVNLLYMYNTLYNETGSYLQEADALSDPDFLRFAAYEINLYKTYLRDMSTLFNVGGAERYTPDDKQVLVLNSQFAQAQKAFLQSGTIHNEMVSIGNYEEVPFWQASGSSYAYADTTKIDVDIDEAGTKTRIQAGKVLGILFDKDAVEICNTERAVDTQYNGKARFTNYFYHYIAGYFHDRAENAVVFYAQESRT